MRGTDPTFEESFWARVEQGADCWEWTATKNNYGYGFVKVEGKLRGAHRVAYQLAVGTIPEGMVIDHICHNVICVNPKHLRAVTHKQNLENQKPTERPSASGIRGVYRSGNRWRVQVRHDGQFYWGGRFSDLAEAEAAAIALRNRLYTHNDMDRRAS